MNKEQILPYSRYLKYVDISYCAFDRYRENKDILKKDVIFLRSIVENNNNIINTMESLSDIMETELYNDTEINKIKNRYIKLFNANSTNKRKSVDVGIKRLLKNIERRNKKHLRSVNSFNKKRKAHINKVKKEYERENKKINDYIEAVRKAIIKKKIKL